MPKKILIDGGYITLNDTIPEYHYYLKDHLDNNRVEVNIDGTVEQVNHYYPFGGLLGESTGCSVQWYKYNGKEFDRTHGLDWYDYGARFMTPDIGRFTTIDPLAEKYYSISPYVYCVDNPIRNIDPLGDTILVINKCNTFKYENGKLYNKDGNLYKGENGKLKGFLSQVVNALGKISATKTGNNLIHNLSQSEHNYSISKGVNMFVVNSIGRASVKRVAPQYNGPVGSGGIIYWNYNIMESGPNALGNNTRPPFIGLGHELGHTETARLGMSDFSLYNGSAIDYELRKVTNDEYNAVKYENLLRKENSIPIRVAYTKDSEDNLFMPFD